MAPIDLSGTGVALITPFFPDKTIDYNSLGKLIDYQINCGIDYIVALGTTSENPTLSPEERDAVCRFIVDRVNGRVPLVKGCGGNDTAAIVRELQSSDLSAFAAILSVVPFYNKPTQDGIYAHYAAIAEASPVPVILYNVPGRTGVNMTAETTLRLATAYPSIVAIKEASGNIQQVNDIIVHKRTDFQVISGDDAITLPLISLGAVGVISVISNAFPRDFSHMVRLALNGDLDKARAIHKKYADLFRLLFIDGNPAGVKCVLHDMDMISNELRLPLTPVHEDTGEKIRQFMQTLD